MAAAPAPPATVSASQDRGLRGHSGAALVDRQIQNARRGWLPQAPLQGSEPGSYNFPVWNGVASPQPWGMSSYSYLELQIPMRSATPLLGQPLTFRVSPDLGVVGYPQVGMQVTGEVIFRTDMENDDILSDLCQIGTCTVAP